MQSSMWGSHCCWEFMVYACSLFAAVWGLYWSLQGMKIMALLRWGKGVMNEYLSGFIIWIHLWGWRWLRALHQHSSSSWGAFVTHNGSHLGNKCNLSECPDVYITELGCVLIKPLQKFRCTSMYNDYQSTGLLKSTHSKHEKVEWMWECFTAVDDSGSNVILTWAHCT